jgi:predicted Zn-dependent protease
VRAAVGLVGLVAGGCAVNPVSGRPEVTLVSEARERELGEDEARRVAETIGLLDDAVLVAYVRAVGERLARGAPRTDVRYTFEVVDTEQPDAFALPGGHVYVSRGLLALTNSEDELAGVLGHEIGHVAANGVEAVAPLRSGQLVKAPVMQTYPRRASGWNVSRAST